MVAVAPLPIELINKIEEYFLTPIKFRLAHHYKKSFYSEGINESCQGIGSHLYIVVYAEKYIYGLFTKVKFKKDKVMNGNSVIFRLIGPEDPGLKTYPIIYGMRLQDAREKVIKLITIEEATSTLKYKYEKGIAEVVTYEAKNIGPGIMKTCNCMHCQSHYEEHHPMIKLRMDPEETLRQLIKERTAQMYFGCYEYGFGQDDHDLLQLIAYHDYLDQFKFGGGSVLQRDEYVIDQSNNFVDTGYDDKCTKGNYTYFKVRGLINEFFYYDCFKVSPEMLKKEYGHGTETFVYEIVQPM